jgi:hypothetical protein
LQSGGCNSRVATQKNLTLNVATAAKVARLQLLQLLATSAIVGNVCNYWQCLQLLATSDWSAAIIILFN